MKSVLFLVVTVAVVWAGSLQKTTSRLSEVQINMEPDTLRGINSPGKGILEPSDNLIDTALTLPKKHFAMLNSNDAFLIPSNRGMSLVRSEVGLI